MRLYKLIIVLLFTPFILFSQEIISDLSVNFLQKDLIKTIHSNKSEKTNYIVLPFKDDFSLLTVFPSSDLWADKYAFVNNTYPINPLTTGVVTLDALNDSGMIYAHANSSSFVADYLTSNPVRLDSALQGANLIPVKISDSIYFSFYYQPQGIGNKPEGHDSLVLEFFSPADSMWHWIWSDAGKSFQDFYDLYQIDFKQVMISITDSSLYFHKDFRFRFYNYASIANSYEPSWAGNVDQWHIDYIYFNKGRSINDTVYEDVAFTGTPQSLLNKYQSVPWTHYSSSFQMNTSEELPYANLSAITKNVSRNFSIIDLFDNSVAFNYSGGNQNLLPFTTENFSSPVSYTFSSLSTDTALFELRATINTTPDVNRNNDTIRFYQRFYNYYAYDDGIPENGYGLSTNNAMLAYKFTTAVADTLKAIQMFFNQTYQNANQKYFYLTIWTGTNEPETIIYQKAGLTPMFEDELNKYHSYHLDTTLIINGTFFIGWKQTTSDNLNIGFDRNTNSKENIFYNVSGTWMNSMYDGSLMIRPIFGKMFNTSINNSQDKILPDFTVYPNPNRGDIINFTTTLTHTEDFTNYYVCLNDIMGRVIFQVPFSTTIECPVNLAEGIYFYSILNHTNPSYIHKGKLIISR